MKAQFKEMDEIVNTFFDECDKFAAEQKSKSALFQELYGISLSGANTESRLNQIIEKHETNN